MQLATYAIAQVPVGLLLDRFGSRALITGGSIVVGLGQVTLALADQLPLAYAARILLGFGDAALFNSVLRLLPRWFEPKRVPLLTQITGICSSLGQIAAVGIVLPLIHGLGWRDGLLIAASLCLVGREAPSP
nr:MFS transporter [Tessaracoccus coleopterorum]